MSRPRLAARQQAAGLAAALMLSVLVVLLGIGVPFPAAATAAGPADPAVQRLSKGVSLPGWFANTDLTPARFQGAYTVEDLNLIARLGFRNLRLPIQPEVLFDESSPERLNPDNLAYVDRAVQSTLQAGLNVTVDVHPSFAVDPKTGLNAFDQRLHDPAFADLFARFWGALASHYSTLDPQRVFLEPLNEPESWDPAVWQPVAAKAVAAIRQVAPNHTIIIDACGWANFQCLQRMAPLDDPNTVYAVHYYEPGTFTYQGANWPATDPGIRFAKRLPYPSSPRLVRPLLRRVRNPAGRRVILAYGRERWNRARLQRDIKGIAAWSARNHRQVIVNEFGVVLSCFADHQARDRWVRDLRQLLDAYGLAWNYWEYNDAIASLPRTEVCGKPPAPRPLDRGFLAALLGA